MTSWERISARSEDTRVATLWTTTALVAHAANVASSYIDVGTDVFHTTLLLGKTSTTGTYAFEIDWSNDGTTLLLTETVTITEATTTTKVIAAKYAKFRVKNTHVSDDFTAHTTFVNVR